ncbi:MAG TPA: response regulator transcription factor [Candidatus Krumholzibacteria bacterium]|nr:response regulator transcription factor [Candidatus Krumholzibacteria bacterium]HPD70926.1 response regulator transcription factor [Candidatus Krumholzibacteria bacterium]HRY39374.1 response regulator transcription factor [Candidatus Krumholzibacteria bacterium]
MRERILIVDDEAPVAGLLEHALRHEGYDVAKAADGMDAMNRLQSFKPDVVIMDIMMPRLDGVQTTRLLRRNRNYAETVIIALSARTDDAARDAMRDAGANLYMRKPFTIARLVERVRELLDARAKTGP